MAQYEALLSKQDLKLEVSPGALLQVCLMMDEVDGMSAGDRGGVADLIQTIHKSKIPIICICNDKWHQKLKSLRNHCMALEFRYRASLECRSVFCVGVRLGAGNIVGNMNQEIRT